MGGTKSLLHYFTKTEAALWSFSVLFISLSFAGFDRENYLSLGASLLGVTSLIFCAKGNPAGQLMMVLFSLLYGYISYGFAYYGEMLTYLGMTAPMALVSLVSWLKNPYEGKRSEVKVNRIGWREILFMLLLALPVTAVFYFILKNFGTANLVPSTFSVTTSFVAVYLTYRRSCYFALAYALNDLVLIVLWGLASLKDSSYVSVLACFIVFFLNDLYGFYSWQKMQRRQEAGCRDPHI